jgi:SAM-dependent methyltransferase
MLGTKTIDPGKTIDWGKTSRDYAEHRPGPPDSFYKKLAIHDVGLKGQKVLDLGTGTGVVARRLASEGCDVIGTDISKEQILMAQELAKQEGLTIDFFQCPSEDIDFEADSFDVIIANQCFLYFDKDVVVPKIKKYLKSNGVFVTSHFSWLPLVDPVAKASEELILKHNSNWTAHSYSGKIPPMHGGLESDFDLKAFFYYDEGIPFSKDRWRGRIRACRGIGAALSPAEVESFDKEHDELLQQKFDPEFEVLHRIDAHIMVDRECVES